MVGNLFALGVSTLYIVLTSLIAYWSRKYVDYYIRQPFLRALFHEGIATAELCGACFELIISTYIQLHINYYSHSLKQIIFIARRRFGD